MKICLLVLLTTLAASVSGVVPTAKTGVAGSAALAAPTCLDGRGVSNLLSLCSIPVGRSFRCPVVLSAANTWTAATTVPSGMAFALTSLTLTDSSGTLLAYDPSQTRRQLRLVGSLCTESFSLPVHSNPPETVANIALDQRKLEFDPPMLFYPGDPFALEISNIVLGISGSFPSPLPANDSLSLVIGGYVLYPGEY